MELNLSGHIGLVKLLDLYDSNLQKQKRRGKLAVVASASGYGGRASRDDRLNSGNVNHPRLLTRWKWITNSPSADG
jgi:hypothetical protein